MTRRALVLVLVAVACTPGPGSPPADGASLPPVASGPVDHHPPGPPRPADAPAPAVANAAGPAPLGSSTSSVSGCLASPGRTAQTRGAPGLEPKPELVVRPVEGGATVAHQVSHACCLESKVSTEVQGSTVTITESLFGTPCRCICSSTISTTVRLGPGDYTLKVVFDHNGDKSVSEQKLTVK